MITNKEALDAVFVLQQFVEQQKANLAPSDKQKALILDVAKALNINLKLELMTWKDARDFLDKYLPEFYAKQQAVTAKPR